MREEELTDGDGRASERDNELFDVPHSQHTLLERFATRPPARSDSDRVCSDLFGLLSFQESPAGDADDGFWKSGVVEK